MHTHQSFLPPHTLQPHRWHATESHICLCILVNHSCKTTHTHTHELCSCYCVSMHTHKHSIATCAHLAHHQCRQDEGGPKLLHFGSPSDSQFRGGFGYLTERGSHGVVASSRANGTVSPLGTPGFVLEFGVGYVQNKCRSSVRRSIVAHGH
jgi:hypothetical protein